MLVMGLDTALQRCSVAILRDGEVIADKFLDMERGHAEQLAPMAAAALDTARAGVKDLDRVGVVVGPGGFTGVRIALSFARGLAIGTEVKVIAVTSLEALAGNVEDGDPSVFIAPMVDARRGQIYAGLYEKSGYCLIEPFVSDPQEALKILVEKAGDAPVLTIGSGARLAAAPAHWRPSTGAAQIDSRIVARIAASAPAPSGPPAPLYLRAPDAKPPKPGRFSAIGA